jgi:hypothetical protein
MELRFPETMAKTYHDAVAEKEIDTSRLQIII